MSVEVMRQALEALEQINQLSIGEDAIALPGEIDAAMDSLRAAIEQSEKQEPVAWMYDFMSDNRDEVIRNWVTQSQDDIKRENGFNVRPLYTAPPPKYRRGTYVRCMESDELCRVWTTSIDGGAWVKWPDGSITTYTAEQMGRLFSLEQAAPGNPEWVGLTDEEIVELIKPAMSYYGYNPDHAVLTSGAGFVGLADAIEAKLKEKNAA